MYSPNLLQAIQICVVWMSLGLRGSTGSRSRFVLGLSVCNIKLLFCLPPTKFIVGIVYHAVNVISKKNVAIKLEPIDMENPKNQDCPQAKLVIATIEELLKGRAQELENHGIIIPFHSEPANRWDTDDACKALIDSRPDGRCWP